MEDNQKFRKGYSQEKDKRKRSGLSVSPRRLSEKKMITTPPPPRSFGPQDDGGQVPDNAGVLYSLSTACTTSDGSTRATDCSGDNSIDRNVQEDGIESKKTGSITINGVDIRLVQKKRMDTMMKKSVPGTCTPRGRKKKETSTTPSSENISKYFVKKARDNSDGDKEGRQNSTIRKTIHEEDRSKEGGRRMTVRKKEPEETLVKKVDDEKMKTTFRTMSVKGRQTTMKEHIRMFQKLAEGEECVIGSGRCSSHNTKLVRSVVKRKVCSVNEEGAVSWPMGEAVILACPFSKQSSSEVAAGTSQNQFVGTNGRKKLRIMSDNDEDTQSQTRLAENVLAGRNPIGGD